MFLATTGFFKFMPRCRGESTRYAFFRRAAMGDPGNRFQAARIPTGGITTDRHRIRVLQIQWGDNGQLTNGHHFMSLLDKKTLHILFTTLAIAALLAFVWLARKPLLTFLFAMLFAYLLEPLIAQLEKRTHSSRGLAISAVYVALLVALLTVGMAIGPRVLEEGRHLSNAAPELYNKVASGSIAFQVGRARGWSEHTQAAAQQFIVGHRDQVLATISAQSSKATEIASNALWLVLVPILAIFFLNEKSSFARSIEGLLDNQRSRQLLSDIMSDLDDMLSHFVRAQLYLAAISGAVYIAALTLMRVPYSWALGTLGGLLEFIPFVGPLVAGTLILAVSFGLNYGHLVMVVLFLVIWRGLEDYVVSPRVLGGRVEVHPLAAIFGVLAGGEIAGVAGIYFAVPVMASARILWIHWRRHNNGNREPDPTISREIAKKTVPAPRDILPRGR
jgi:predicted PurR-regulated permease PerM